MKPWVLSSMGGRQLEIKVIGENGLKNLSFATFFEFSKMILYSKVVNFNLIQFLKDGKIHGSIHLLFPLIGSRFFSLALWGGGGKKGNSGGPIKDHDCHYSGKRKSTIML